MIAVIFTAANLVGLSQLWEATETEEKRVLVRSLPDQCTIL